MTKDEIAESYIRDNWQANWDMQSLSKGKFTVHFNEHDIRLTYTDLDVPHGQIAHLTLMYHTWSKRKSEAFIDMCRLVNY